MRWTSIQSGSAVGRPDCESSLLGHPDTRFFRSNELKADKNKRGTVRTKLGLRQLTTVDEPSAASRVC